MGVFTRSSCGTKAHGDPGTDLGGQMWGAVGVMEGVNVKPAGEPPARCAVLRPHGPRWLDCKLLQGRAGAEPTSVSPGNSARDGFSVNIMS